MTCVVLCALAFLAWCISIGVVLAVVAGSRERSRQDHPSSGRNAMVFRIGFFVCAPGSPVQVTVQFMAYDTNFSLLIACMFMLLQPPKEKTVSTAARME